MMDGDCLRGQYYALYALRTKNDEHNRHCNYLHRGGVYHAPHLACIGANMMDTPRKKFDHLACKPFEEIK